MRRHGSGELGHFESHVNCRKQWKAGRLRREEVGEDGANMRENRGSWTVGDQLLCDNHLTISSMNI